MGKREATKITRGRRANRPAKVHLKDVTSNQEKKRKTGLLKDTGKGKEQVVYPIKGESPTRCKTKERKRKPGYAPFLSNCHEGGR